MSAMNAFKVFCGVWTAHLENRRPTLSKPGKTVTSHQKHAHLDKVEFNQHFGQLDIMEDIAAFIWNPFLPIGTVQVAAKIQQEFASPSDRKLKGRSRDGDLGGLVSREKFPLLTMCTYSVYLPLWDGIFTDENNQIKAQELPYRRHTHTTSDWLSVSMCQTTKHSQAVFSHRHHHIDWSEQHDCNSFPSDGTVKGDAA